MKQSLYTHSEWTDIYNISSSYLPLFFSLSLSSYCLFEYVDAFSKGFVNFSLEIIYLAVQGCSTLISARAQTTFIQSFITKLPKEMSLYIVCIFKKNSTFHTQKSCQIDKEISLYIMFISIVFDPDYFKSKHLKCIYELFCLFVEKCSFLFCSYGTL